jgi:large subunit ribosomal protein L6
MLKFNLPKNVKVSWGVDFIKVEGPLGIIIKKKDTFLLAIKEDSLYLWVPENESKENAYLVMIKNLILGVSKGYRQRLKLVGVGFKASIKDNKVFLKIGYSHEISYIIPEDVQIVSSKAKGTFLLIKGKEKDRVNQVAKEIRALRQPDAYKGKGIHYNKEVLKLKKGKREGK